MMRLLSVPQPVLPGEVYRGSQHRNGTHRQDQQPGASHHSTPINQVGAISRHQPGIDHVVYQGEGPDDLGILAPQHQVHHEKENVDE